MTIYMNVLMIMNITITEHFIGWLVICGEIVHFGLLIYLLL